MITLIAGREYLLNYRKGREVFLYNGTDMGGCHVFVNNKALYRVAPGALESCNPELVN